MYYYIFEIFDIYSELLGKSGKCGNLMGKGENGFE